MKLAKLFAATLAASTIAGSAFAADLPSRRVAPAPILAPAPIFTWTGLYVGLNAGYAWSRMDMTNVATGIPVAGFVPAVFPGLAALATGQISQRNAGGFIGGGQIGFNYQMNSFVAGIEADIQGLAGSRSNSTLATGAVVVGVPVNSILSADAKLDYLGTLRGRLGFLVTPTFLVYGTGGLAYGGVKANVAVWQAGNNGFVGTSAASLSSARVGWTAGAGVEYAFSPNWSAKIEYLHYDLGTVSVGHAGVSAFFAPAALYQASVTRVRTRGDLVRAGVNYRFGWGAPAPVVARY